MASAKSTLKSKIRRLQPGEPLPTGKPHRYVTSHGYVVLRWRVAAPAYVEVHEHRLVCGMPPNHLHIHHINGIKHDNRRENLQIMTPSAHASLAVTFDTDAAMKAYAAGASYPELSRMFGVHQVSIMRALKNRGMISRPSPKHKTHCNYGHKLSGTNLTIWVAPNGRRVRHCRTCARERARKHYLRSTVRG